MSGVAADHHEDKNKNEGKTQKKPGVWKVMPYILGNEAFANLAANGMFANFLVYLTRDLHIDTTFAANIMSICSGLSNFGPLLGAFILMHMLNPLELKVQG